MSWLNTSRTYVSRHTGLMSQDMADTGRRVGVSKARLVTTAVTVEKRSVAKVATRLSRATINRILTRHGVVTPEPEKRPKSSYLRFQAAMPNECWASDFTHYRLAEPDGQPRSGMEIPRGNGGPICQHTLGARQWGR